MHRSSKMDSPDTLVSEAVRCLNVVGGNLVQLLGDLNTSPDCLSQLQVDIGKLESETASLRRNVVAVLSAASQAALGKSKLTPPPPWPRNAGMAERLQGQGQHREEELRELRAQVVALQRDYDRAAAQLAATQGEAGRLRSQLTHQSAFCASLGAVLGNLVWKASRVPPVVDLLLAGNKVADFLCIVSGTLESFLETYDTEMPGPSADECQFIMAMGGIVTNMAAAPAGRQFLVSNPNGRDLILQIIRILPAIPTPSGNCLKRLLLMALYNVSINQAGLHLLLEEGKGTIFAVATNCLKPESTDDLRIMALRLLLSLTCEMNDPALLAKVPRDLVSQIADSEDPQLQTMAQEVKDNVWKAQERIKEASRKMNGASSPQGTFMEPQPAIDKLGIDKRPTAQPTTAWRLPSHQ